MDKKAMLKQAAQTLRDQKHELDTLHEKIARDEKAELIVKALVESDDLLATDVLRKLSELRTKSIGELEIMEKAAEMYSNSFSAGLGKLAGVPSNEVDSLTAYLLEEY